MCVIKSGSLTTKSMLSREVVDINNVAEMVDFEVYLPSFYLENVQCVEFEYGLYSHLRLKIEDGWMVLEV